MSGRGGGGRGGRGGGRGGRGGGRSGGIADLSLGTLTFADILATSRADVGDVLYPTQGVQVPNTDGPTLHEEKSVSLDVDRWLFSSVKPERSKWVVEGELKKRKKSNGSGITNQISRLGLNSTITTSQSSSSNNQDFLYSDRYKSNTSQSHSQSKQTNVPDTRVFLDQKYFPTELWTSYIEGKKTILKTKKRKVNKSNGLDQLEDDGDGEEKEGEEEEEEAIIEEEEEIDEDDPDYDNNYFDNGEDDDGAGSGGDGGGDEGLS
ncbi:uncharacterized protein MELLADRAFT_52606 [Melampsora larici-populina 98AG31]|uniref:DNA-directed RNA polymerase III subunit n=1 Tax=Melampsora larici-populina (strain 98AG31 / pathotype 3-4-7) TaxID=747676 RepID=F4RME8_MELLP|nr:uncharacterized protein MELLADRAFT_52606 [Melampsora larici-populina 98AG31]EGG06485.1 hypothetical protein MELLADRAFT_52606 [Melampsora larici-populina 98AG31]